MTLAPQHFAYVRDLVHRRAAIVLEPGKEYLVESRLLPLARSTGDVDVAALVARLKEVPETHRLHELVVDAMTTNETSWFRDHHPFAALATAVVPDLIRRRGAERSLRIWSAACSSGQEPYTIAMTLADLMAAQPGWRLEILGTDLSAEMLERAPVAQDEVGGEASTAFRPAHQCSYSSIKSITSKVLLAIRDSAPHHSGGTEPAGAREPPPATLTLPMGNSVSGRVGNYVNGTPSDLGNFMTGDSVTPLRARSFTVYREEPTPRRRRIGVRLDDDDLVAVLLGASWAGLTRTD